MHSTLNSAKFVCMFVAIAFCALLSACNVSPVSKDDFKSSASSLGFVVIDGSSSSNSYLLAKKNNCEVHLYLYDSSSDAKDAYYQHVEPITEPLFVDIGKPRPVGVKSQASSVQDVSMVSFPWQHHISFVNRGQFIFATQQGNTLFWYYGESSCRSSVENLADAIKY